MTYHIIINPASGGGKTGKRVEEISEIAGRTFDDYKIIVTKVTGEAVQMAVKAAENAVDAVIVVGGDGTIGEVTNGLLSRGKTAEERPILGLVSSGSGGDFCRTFDVSHSIEEAFERITRNEPQLIDVGFVIPANGKKRIFANIASTGLSAEIGVNTNKAKWLKKINGAFAFNWTIVSTTLRHKRFPLRIKTSSDPEGKLWDANCVAMCNGQYFGSGVRMARDADPSDGLLDVVVVHDLPPVGFLKGVTEIKKNDSYVSDGITKSKAAWVEISCEDPNREVPIETDGEFAGNLPARFEVIPSAIRLF